MPHGPYLFNLYVICFQYLIISGEPLKTLIFKDYESLKL